MSNPRPWSPAIPSANLCPACVIDRLRRHGAGAAAQLYEDRPEATEAYTEGDITIRVCAAHAAQLAGGN